MNEAVVGLRWRTLHVFLAAVALSISAQRAIAATPEPDIYGIWIGVGPGRPDIDPRWRNKRFTPTPEFTAWGAAESQRLGRIGTEIAPAGQCDPVHPVQFLNGSGLFPLQILRGANQIVMLSEFVSVPRRIYMDGRGHPADVDPSWEGHSIGHWEGNVLVIDTVGFNGRSRPLNSYAAAAVDASPESVTVPRLPGSDQLHLAERIQLVGDGNILEVAMVITDPKTYIRPFTATTYYERRPDIDMQEYVCADNTRVADEGHTEEGTTP